MEEEIKKDDYIKGRGAQISVHNRFMRHEYITEHWEGIDEDTLIDGERKTKVFYEHPKKIINKVESPDVGGMFSMNPYQGCEHGCIYCYARNSHEYWGFGAGIDFERNIVVKENAPQLLEEALRKKSWVPEPIMLSGNTDCYQPLERKFRITQKMLQVLNEFNHPVSIISKNQLILRDIELLREMASKNLVHVTISITTLKEDLRLKMEPRTASAKNRLKVVSQLSEAGIPTGILIGPVIPSLNSMEIPSIVKAGFEAGAKSVGYVMVRLNGAIGKIFEDWVTKNFPDRANRVLNQIKEVHGGTLNESRWGVRMKGEGNVAESIRQLHAIAVNKYRKKKDDFEFDLTKFKVPPKENDQLKLF
jgi:DNA repair photolyase